MGAGWTNQIPFPRNLDCPSKWSHLTHAYEWKWGTGCEIKLGNCEVACLYQAPRDEEHTHTSARAHEHTHGVKGTEALARKVSYHTVNFLCPVCNYSIYKRLGKGSYHKLKGIWRNVQATKHSSK